jgi:hypothetical protein
MPTVEVKMAAVNHDTHRIPGQIAERIQNGVLLVGLIAWAAMSLYVIMRIL